MRGVQPVDAPEDYYGRLAPLCADVDIWTTTYLHVLRGEDPVVDWMSGTGLRPYLQALPDSAEREAFLDVYRRVVAEAMPPRPDGSVLFPFPPAVHRGATAAALISARAGLRLSWSTGRSSLDSASTVARYPASTAGS